jgi:hypothetical protein
VRFRRWELPDEPPPAHPYRNSVIVYGILAAVIVLVAWATAGDLTRAAVVAVVFFVVATAWSWRSWRIRLREEAAKQERRAGARPRAGGREAR